MSLRQLAPFGKIGSALVPPFDFFNVVVTFRQHQRRCFFFSVSPVLLLRLSASEDSPGQQQLAGEVSAAEALGQRYWLQQCELGKGVKDIALHAQRQYDEYQRKP